MGGSDTLVSVVIPAFNAERWIAQTLASILSQTHRNLEIIVVDDGSTDRTADVAAAALAGFAGRSEVIRQPNRGVAATRNTGARASRGPWIHFMDADDLVSADMTEVLLREGRRHPDAAVVYGPYRRFFDDEAGQRTFSGSISRPDVDPSAPASLLHNIPLIPAALVSRAWFDRIGGFDEALRYVAEDRDFLIRMALAGGLYVFADSPEPIYLYRMFPGAPRLGGSNARYHAADSMFVWMMSLKRCVGSKTLRQCNLRPTDEDGIIRNTRFILWKMLEDGQYEAFDRYVAEFRQIVPGFVPRRPRLRWALAKLMGYDAAARLERVVSLPFRRRTRPGSGGRYESLAQSLQQPRSGETRG